MHDLFATSSAWLKDVFRDECSQAVTYRRGASSVELAATIGEPPLVIDEPHPGQRIGYTQRDFIVALSDLVLSGQRTLPAVHDTITTTIGGQLQTFEVLPIAGGSHMQPDPYHDTVRVHTKLVPT